MKWLRFMSVDATIYSGEKQIGPGDLLHIVSKNFRVKLSSMSNMLLLSLMLLQTEQRKCRVASHKFGSSDFSSPSSTCHFITCFSTLHLYLSFTLVLLIAACIFHPYL
jgi:hypothetical protein